MSEPVTPSGHSALEIEQLQRNWWLFLIFGLVSVIAGFVAIGHAFTATVVSVMVVGILLMVAGVTEVIHAFMGRHGKAFALHMLAAALYLIVGLFMLEDPVQAAVVLTLLFAASFLVGGLLRILFSATTQFPGWPWVALNGVVDLVLGIMIWNRWPESSLWVIGLFVGIDLIFHGWAWVALAMTVRNSSPSVSA